MRLTLGAVSLAAENCIGAGRTIVQDRTVDFMSDNERDVVNSDLVSDQKVVSRRDVLKKYGAYSAPAVIALLVPQQTVAMFSGTAYSSLAACQTAHGGMTMHCNTMHDISP